MGSKRNTVPLTDHFQSVPVDPGILVRTLSPLPGVVGTVANSTSVLLAVKVVQLFQFVYSRAPMICYNVYVKRGPTWGVTGTWQIEFASL